MKNAACTLQETLSPSDVLAFFRDWHRFDCSFDCIFDVNFASRIDDWQASCEMFERSELGAELSLFFKISTTDAEWSKLLHMDAKLEEVCAFISSKGAQKYLIVPFKIAGVECLPAGAFFALRSALVDEGLSVAACKPSASIEQLLDEHLGAFLLVAAKLAPGTVPAPVSRFQRLFRRSFWNAMLIMFGVTLLLFFLAPTYFVWQLFIEEFVYFVVLAAVCMRWIKLNFASNYYFENVRTFADMSRLLVPPYTPDAVAPDV